jgi:hypothetical protein
MITSRPFHSIDTHREDLSSQPPPSAQPCSPWTKLLRFSLCD